MSEVAIRDDRRDEMVPAGASASPLVLWAYEARQAAMVAASLAKTSFVPASFRGKPEDITAAILAGQELGLRPMAALRAMDIIQGTPALRAHAMRGLVQAKGHEIELLESTETRCRMRGRRRGSDQWQTVTWTIERAAKLGLTGREQWKKQPQTMLVARATAEICRLIAADALYAMPYAAEELSDDLPASIDAPAASTPSRRTARRKRLPPEPADDEKEPEPALEQPMPELEPTPEPEPMRLEQVDEPDDPPLDIDWPEPAQPGSAGIHP